MIYGKKEGNEKRIALDIASFLLNKKQQPVIMCVGSDKVVGDSLGVIVGEILKNNPKFKNRVYGDLNSPINRSNLCEKIEEIKSKHPNSPVIVVDAVLGKDEEVGCIKTLENGVLAGGEFGKGYMIGDFSILGVVSCSGISALSFLGAVRLKIVIELSRKIAESICYSEKLSFGL